MDPNSTIKTILDTPDQIEDSTEISNNPQQYSLLSLEEVNALKGLSEESHIKIIDQIIAGKSLSFVLSSFADLPNSQKDNIPSEINGTDHYDHELLNVDLKKGLSYSDLSSFIPLRLSYNERRVLQLLESTLEVSDYTNKIDIVHTGHEARRINREIKNFCAILCGLAIAHNYEDGQRLLKNYDFSRFSEFFKAVFEIGRRYKILNPDRMRTSYGKLMYFLMDSRKQLLQGLIDFDTIDPIQTISTLLRGKKYAQDLLNDPLLPTASMAINPIGKTRKEIDKEVHKKDLALKQLCKRYSSSNQGKKPFTLFGINLNPFGRNPIEAENEEDSDQSQDLSVEEIEHIVHSFSDYNSHLLFSREPCDRMIQLLKEYFHPYEPDHPFSLAISIGQGGSRLMHDHTKQYRYVYQSLCLWREIAQNMFVLWHHAEADLLNARNIYRLRDTGQGLQRIQEAPLMERKMNQVIHTIKAQTGDWIGSTIVHHGDRNVPNALMFIDKYTQIPRILGPIVVCLDKLQEIYDSTKSMKQYLDNEFGGLHKLRKIILCDFFRHGFDGSGADSFNDAGSCIDGRLTSAWNWCSNIEKKEYFPAFLLTGFNGFDGKF